MAVILFVLSHSLLHANEGVDRISDKHDDGLQSDLWILLKCFRSGVTAGSP